MPVEVLSEYRITARNTSASSENKIHDDVVARQYGFPGALVPGVTIYAYLTHPLTTDLGRPWLERGTAAVRFLKPVMAGDPVVVTGEVTARTARGVEATISASTTSGVCATLAATLPAGLATPVDLIRYPRASLPVERPLASRAQFESLRVLGAPQTDYDRPRAVEYLAAVGDDCPIYEGPNGVVHPAFLLTQANRVLSGNVQVGPWIHAGSVVRHLGLARVGDTLTTRGHVRSLYERKGREYVELDLVVVAGDKRPVAHVLHTAIYCLPPPGADIDSRRTPC